jgi:hypothetical protein
VVCKTLSESRVVYSHGSRKQSAKSQWQTDFRFTVRISCFSGALLHAQACLQSSNAQPQPSLSCSKVSAAPDTLARAPSSFRGPLGSHHLEIPRDRLTALGTAAYHLHQQLSLLRIATTDPRHSQDLISCSSTQGDRASPNTTHIKPAATPLRNHESRVVSLILVQ